MTTTPTKTMPPPPAPPPAPARTYGQPPRNIGERVLLYGIGGAGKTTLASRLPGDKLYIDLDMSLAKLGINLPCEYPENWTDYRKLIQGLDMPAGSWAITDSCTELQTMCERWVVANVRTEKGMSVRNVEGYGYGKGYRHIFDEWCCMMADFDRLVRKGVNVCFIAHSSEFSVDNVDGEDFKRIEPKLQDAGDGGKSSIKEKMRDWCAHVLCIREDVAVAESGKAKGCGTRSMYGALNPYCIAKSRQDGGRQLPVLPITPTNGADVWQQVFNQ